MVPISRILIVSVRVKQYNRESCARVIHFLQNIKFSDKRITGSASLDIASESLVIKEVIALSRPSDFNLCQTNIAS
jgi:hypothetical protein